MRGIIVHYTTHDGHQRHGNEPFDETFEKEPSQLRWWMKVQTQVSHLSLSQGWEVRFLVLDGLIGRRGSACRAVSDVRNDEEYV